MQEQIFYVLRLEVKKDLIKSIKAIESRKEEEEKCKAKELTEQPGTAEQRINR
jgi:hypothetical protein